MKAIRSAAWVVLAVLGLATAARASIGPVWSDDQMVGFAKAIVMGRVANIAVGRDPATGDIYTYVTVTVSDVLKGDIPERQIVLKQLGGTIGDVGLAVSGQATFARDEDVLLYLEVRPRDGTLYTSALWQGKWNLGEDAVTGARIATRLSALARERGAFAGEPERRDLTALTNRIRSLAPRRVDEPTVRPFRVAPTDEEMAGAVQQVLPLPYSAMGFRWNEFDTRTSIPMDVQASGQPGLSGGGAAELNRAIGAWTNVSPISLTTVGTGTYCEGSSSPAQPTGHVAVAFDDPCSEIDDSGGILAQGGAWFTSSGGRTVGGVSYSRAISGFLITNNSSIARNFLSNSGCFQQVETHEFGHTLGMGHTTDAGAIMYPTISASQCSSGAQPLNADDRAGFLAMYPSSTPTSTAPGAPTGATATASGSTVTISWTAPSSGGTPTGYFLEAGSATGLANLANFNTGTTATSYVASGVASGTYYIRVRATNASGTSAASNEATVAVGGGCSGAPGAPSGLAVTSNAGGRVTLSWTASSGSPTTYLVEAGSVPGAANLANLDLGSSATSFSATAGSGTYYVRVRGKNACGTGPVSNEVTLVIP